MSNVHHDQGQRRAWFAALAYNLIPFNVAADWYLCPVCARESAIDFLSFIRTTFHAHHPIRWSSTFGHYPSRPDDSFFSGRALLVARLTIFFGWSEPQRWLMDGFPCVDDQSILHGRKYHNRNGVKCRCRYSIIEIGREQFASLVRITGIPLYRDLINCHLRLTPFNRPSEKAFLPLPFTGPASSQVVASPRRDSLYANEID